MQQQDPNELAHRLHLIGRLAEQRWDHAGDPIAVIDPTRENH
ncbi:hypothetical protein ACPPVT_17370 [Angustibacter sp. McL0619]